MLHLLILLASHSFFGPELSVQNRVGLLELGNSFLQGLVFCLDILVLLLEQRRFLTDKTQCFALGLES